MSHDRFCPGDMTQFEDAKTIQWIVCIKHIPYGSLPADQQGVAYLINLTWLVVTLASDSSNALVSEIADITNLCCVRLPRIVCWPALSPLSALR
jgi:hypothetical protein